MELNDTWGMLAGFIAPKCPAHPRPHPHSHPHTSPSREVDIVTALYSQRYRCKKCSERGAPWKTVSELYVNELRRVLSECPSIGDRDFVEKPFPSFALTPADRYITTNEDRFVSVDH